MIDPGRPGSDAASSAPAKSETDASLASEPAPEDSIAELIGEWRRERPDLDPWPLDILGRIQRLSTHLSRQAEQRLQTLGLTWETFSLIVTLRRAGAPYALRPTDIYRKSLLTSGTITNRIDNVVRMGLAVREPDAQDRRSVAIKLTPAGLEMADRAIEMHLAGMADVLSVLSPSERAQAAALLSILLRSFEQR
ncbi:MarR family winged helix-turn-helix transcriptional regulator [Pseudorhodoplanes sp.]|uniref:MarR family winged helix-turn-helix transcriptional regulator n=1 Tax=Pseudorhodoplanes sp. TaxID=1934341 RepID=UPI00391D2A62